MNNEHQSINTPSEIVLYQPNENISLEVKLDATHETVWLTQQQIADLFGTKQPAISKHLSNIYKSGELDENSTYSILEYMGNDGKQKYKTKYYNLDAIISVGYRVNSVNATAFRRWATNVLRDYLLKGYSVNHQLIALQQHVDDRLIRIEDRLQQHEEQILFFVRTNQPPHEGVVFQGHLLEGREVAEALIKSAKHEVILIDAYVGADTFHILESREANVSATIYTEKVGANILTLQTNHEQEYGTSRHIEVLRYRTDFHDRFLIIDDDVYHFGASLKDLGKRLFAFDLMGLPKSLIMSQVAR